MQRYKITIEYLGTNFKGWQRQRNYKSVQETFERAAKKLLIKGFLNEIFDNIPE